MSALFYPDQELFKVSCRHRTILAKEAQTGDNERNIPFRFHIFRSMIRLDRYRLFVSVASTLSMSRSADALCLTRSAVSHAVREIEEDLGVPLFRRTAGKLALTAEGRQLFERIAPAVRTIEEADRSLRAPKAARHLTLATTHTLLRAFVMPAIARLADDSIRLVFKTGSIMQAINQVRSGEADIGIVALHSTSLPEGLFGQRLMTLHDTFVCRRQDCPAQPISLKDALAQPIVTLARDSITFEGYRRFFESRGLTLTPKAEVHQLDILHDLVSAGFGYGLSYREIVQDVPGLCCLPVGEALPEQTLLRITSSDARDEIIETAGEIGRIFLNRP